MQFFWNIYISYCEISECSPDTWVLQQKLWTYVFAESYILIVWNLAETGWAKSQSLALHHTWGNLPSLPRHHGHRHGHAVLLPWGNQENGTTYVCVLPKKIDFTLNYPQCNDCRNRKNIFWCKPPWSHVVVQVSICFGLPIYGPSCLSSPWTRKLTYCGRFRTERSIITGGNKLVC